MFDFGWSKEDHLATERLIKKIRAVGKILLATVLIAGSTVVAHEIPSWLTPPQIPNHVLVQGRRWDIVRVAPARVDPMQPSLIGVTDCTTRSIRLSSDIYGRQLKLAILHELLHASVCQWNGFSWAPNNGVYDQLPSQEMAHPAIYATTDRLVWIVEENPDLMNYLEEPESKEELRSYLR